VLAQRIRVWQLRTHPLVERSRWLNSSIWKWISAITDSPNGSTRPVASYWRTYITAGKNGDAARAAYFSVTAYILRRHY